MNIKIGIFGNRSATDGESILDGLLDTLKEYGIHPTDAVTILHGGAAGPAQLIEEAAATQSMWTTVVFRPWTMIWNKLKFTPYIFYLRNKQIVDNSDLVFIFSNGDYDSEVHRVEDLCIKWEKKYKIIPVR